METVSTYVIKCNRQGIRHTLAIDRFGLQAVTDMTFLHLDIGATHVDERVARVRPHLGQIKGVKTAGPGILPRRDLHLEIPPG